MSVSYLCDLLNVDGIGIRIAESFDVESLCILVDSRFKTALNVRSNKLCGDPVKRQSVSKKVVSSAVYSL